MSEHESGGRRDVWTRRGVLKGGGALAAISLTATTARAQEPGDFPAPVLGAGAAGDYDAIVIGAGFAGVTAARELRCQGMRVLVLEAHGRVGGRTFTSKLDGHDVELGGAYVHWAQPHVWAELTRYGIEIEAPPQSGEPRAAWIVDGQLHEGGADEATLALFQGSGQFFFDARDVFPLPYDQLASPALAEVDPLSVKDRLDGLNLPPQQRALLDALFCTSCHASPAEAGLVEMLRWYALSGGSLINMIEATGRYGIRGGTRTLIEAILADARPELRLSTPVSAVRQEPELVVVTTEEDETISARALVATVPLNVLGNIEFTPSLSAEKRAAAAEGQVGSGVKLHAKVQGQYGGFLGLAPWPSPISTLIPDYVDETGTMFTAFGPSAELLDTNDDEAVQAAVRTLLPQAELIRAVGYDWNVDPFVRGTWCVFRPGQLSGYLEALRRPEGRVIYAGADNARGWRGFIDGAIESGLRAGREVARMLS